MRQVRLELTIFLALASNRFGPPTFSFAKYSYMLRTQWC
jgi:hypothetical protein